MVLQVWMVQTEHPAHLEHRVRKALRVQPESTALMELLALPVQTASASQLVAPPARS
jgi:hypothetical protein